MRILGAILRLIRFDSSALSFLAIFLPNLVRTHNFAQSVGQAFPLLLISACTFIANDLNDLDRDRLIHPNRPLPAGQIGATTAVILYFVCLGAALFSTNLLVDPVTAFWYYALALASASYGFVVDRLPGFKAPYVSAATAIPVVIISVSFPHELRLRVAIVAVFLLAFGRELCMDVIDRPGDRASFMHRMRPESIAVAAFCLQVGGVLLLASQLASGKDVVALSIVALLVAAASVLGALGEHRYAVGAMKAPLFLGLYFLL